MLILVSFILVVLLRYNVDALGKLAEVIMKVLTPDLCLPGHFACHSMIQWLFL